jgi:hypothetical protein
MSLSLSLSLPRPPWDLGFELSALYYIAKQAIYHLATPPVQFALVILEMESYELFV